SVRRSKEETAWHGFDAFVLKEEVRISTAFEGEGEDLAQSVLLALLANVTHSASLADD
ncbi:hypothetical protein E4U11_008499, partial [Claviceps purpurea]